MIKGIIKKIINWSKSFKEGTLEAQSLKVDKRSRPVPITKSPTKNKSYLNDPINSNLIVEELEPKDTLLAMKALGEMGGGYSLGTIQQQSLSLKIMVNNALLYMASKSPKKITRWSSIQSLNLIPRAGKDVNAYYDRSSLQFFFFFDPILKKNIFACDARPVVVHEFGHAFLDILRPDWWDTQAVEVWAFHEAFGDITAIIASLQYDVLIDNAIVETNGDLMKSSILTRLAAEMGTGLYHLSKGKNGESTNCLRDASQVFNYVEPEKLPSEGRYDQLLQEPHSFARVFTGAFWEALVKIAVSHINQGLVLRDGMKLARDVMTGYLLKAIVNVPTTVRLYDALAKQMLQIDQSEGGKYQSILFEVFTKRGILKRQVLLLNNVDLNSFMKELKEPHEIQVLGTSKIVKTINQNTIKLRDKLGEISALNENPLFDLEISIADQKVYYFENDKLIEINELQEDEIVDSAFNCLNILHKSNLVGNHQNALFEEISGKLVRKQIVCKCGRPNYCDPNAPEYGKPWKPANNSGCVTCGTGNCLPMSCDETTPEKTPAPKIGCFTTIKTGGRTVYKYGSSASRRVC